MSAHMTLEQALAWLPDDADGIALVIYAAGIRGDHGSRTCPLAELLSLLTRRNVFVDMGSCFYALDVTTKRLLLPPAARVFVRNFDGIWSPSNCAYPELEAA